FGVDVAQRPRDAESDRTGLTGDATTVYPGDHVVTTLDLEHPEGVVDDLLVDLVREEDVERLAVDGPLPGARDDANARDGLFATSGGSTGLVRDLARRYCRARLGA